MYYCILLGLCRSCAPRFLLCISLYVTCSMSCTFCVYVICAPSQLAPRIPFLYTVVKHTLSVCSFSTLRRFGRFASDCIDTANLRVGLGMYPGIYPFNPLGWVLSIKNPGFLIESGFFDKTFIIFYNNSSYFTFKVMGNSKFQYEVKEAL